MHILKRFADVVQSETGISMLHAIMQQDTNLCVNRDFSAANEKQACMACIPRMRTPTRDIYSRTRSWFDEPWAPVDRGCTLQKALALVMSCFKWNPLAIVVNGSVHTVIKQLQRVSMQIGKHGCASCGLGPKETGMLSSTLYTECPSPEESKF